MKKVWSETPSLMKYILVVVAAINTTSLASIAENIVKWKGFIKDGVDFYRQSTAPIADFLVHYMSIDIAQWQIDCAAILTIIAFADFRVRLHVESRESRQYMRKPKSTFAVGMKALTVPVLFYSLFILSERFVGLASVVFIGVLCASYIFLHLFYPYIMVRGLLKLNLKGDGHYRDVYEDLIRLHLGKIIRFSAVTIFPVIMICIAAGIQNGLAA